jgi:hypothetical protein
VILLFFVVRSTFGTNPGGPIGFRPAPPIAVVAGSKLRAALVTRPYPPKLGEQHLLI